MVQKVHIKPDSKLAGILKKIVADKLLIEQYIKEGKDTKELETKHGIKFASPL